jgi:hypothetical protein
MEVATVRHRGRDLIADGVQIGAVYGLRYRLEPGLLTVQLTGAEPRRIDLGDADFFDLAWSPLFNSLPVMRDGLLDARRRRTYRMRWVDVPSLEVHPSDQVYEPQGGRDGRLPRRRLRRPDPVRRGRLRAPLSRHRPAVVSPGGRPAGQSEASVADSSAAATAR